MYKGYIATKNKKAISKFKNAPLLSLAEVEKLDEYAGIIDDDYILVDVDDTAQSEILMNIVEALQIDCKVYQTTRGRHFVMKNAGVTKNYTGVSLACGLKADIKLGGNNSYQILKFNGEDRFVEWDASEYQELPFWMRPIKTSLKIYDLEEGEGRNDTLYRYILDLIAHGYSKEQSREILKIINKYVLKTPLSERELDTIMRDDAFPTHVFYDGKKFLHHKFAEFIISSVYIKRINGQLHSYIDGVYKPGYLLIEQAMIRYMPGLSASSRVEVLKYIELLCTENIVSNDASLIAFFNGIYDLKTKTLRPFTPSDVVTNQLPWKYNPASYSEIADKTLNKLACNDPEIRALLEECIGYCFYKRNELSTSFFLTGEKSNGKSTFLDLIRYVLGEDNYTALDMNELDERFSVATMAGKLANIGDDISDEFLQGRTLSTFKKIVSGNAIKAEYKGHDAFFFKPYIKLLFSANDIPRMKDKTGAVLRRMVIIPFNATFSSDDPDFDPYIIWKLKTREVAEYLINLGLAALERVLVNKQFTQSSKVQAELASFKVENNPTLLFIESTPDIKNNSTRDVYRLYRVFCAENGYSPTTLSGLTKELARYLGVEVKRRRIDGKLVSIYVQK